ncbi:Uncharacterized conserved protein, DUF1501 family [Filimonas lacunae]|uniref:Uncharacterized conserved protein, DUF1501 family n=1 Tax=Filimonas lacunae TaxID=477680 RepID=A0A173MFL7_9BACT|nr:DUF1501 domain-containing protein [Filimonas lacunae]BAV06375.1 hypothetical protein FLA_2391 [Filimonas lacunae]SIT26689.1 Uncharacterized conserved protein, DUF1501 family [Filimonas lacunae]
MKRRDFLKNTAAGVLLPYLLNGFSLKAFAGTSLMHAASYGADNDHILVLVQLSGGNDGLNTVIPISQYSAYQAARSNIALPENKLLSLSGTEQTGLHPAMASMHQLMKEGKAGIIQAVGYPQPNFSHFRSSDIWMTGSDSAKIITTGWAGRYLDQVYPEFPEKYPSTVMPDPLAIQVGSIVSETFMGPAYNMGLAISNPTSFYNLVEGKSEIDKSTRLGEQLDYLQNVSVKTDQYSTVIKTAATKVPKQYSQYPAQGTNALADQLKIVARLIAGGLQTKIYLVSLGGFDIHSSQVISKDTTTGTHAVVLKKLSDAVYAFMKDLDYLKVGDKVMGVTFSEFGRRIRSNASGGTDHGAAAPVFYFGNKVKGTIVGKNPTLPEHATENDNIAMQHDFRSLYATLLQQWLKLSPAQSEQVLYGKFPLLPIV